MSKYTHADIVAFARADKQLTAAVDELAALHVILQEQDRNLAAAERDGNLIVFHDWHAAVKAVAKASAEYDALEAIVDPPTGD